MPTYDEPTVAEAAPEDQQFAAECQERAMIANQRAQALEEEARVQRTIAAGAEAALRGMKEYQALATERDQVEVRRA